MKINCVTCNKEFNIIPSYIKRIKNCSLSCSYKYKSKILKGRIFTKEWKDNLKKNHADFKGSNNPMWNTKRESQSLDKNNNWRGGIGVYRREALKYYPNHCENCRIDNKEVLLVHHKDRNRRNNQLDNLQILCRNCHYLEHLKDHG